MADEGDKVIAKINARPGVRPRSTAEHHSINLKTGGWGLVSVIMGLLVVLVSVVLNWI